MTPAAMSAPSVTTALVTLWAGASDAAAGALVAAIGIAVIGPLAVSGVRKSV